MEPVKKTQETGHLTQAERCFQGHPHMQLGPSREGRHTRKKQWASCSPGFWVRAEIQMHPELGDRAVPLSVNPGTS